MNKHYTLSILLLLIQTVDTQAHKIKKSQKTNCCEYVTFGARLCVGVIMTCIDGVKQIPRCFMGQQTGCIIQYNHNDMPKKLFNCQTKQIYIVKNDTWVLEYAEN